MNAVSETIDLASTLHSYEQQQQQTDQQQIQMPEYFTLLGCRLLLVQSESFGIEPDEVSYEARKQVETWTPIDSEATISEFPFLLSYLLCM